MQHSVQPTRWLALARPSATAEPQNETAGRFTLTVVEEHSPVERGYDPYDTFSAHSRQGWSKDIWRLKRRRA
jgi:hypothetical protein